MEKPKGLFEKKISMDLLKDEIGARVKEIEVLLKINDFSVNMFCIEAQNIENKDHSGLETVTTIKYKG